MPEAAPGITPRAGTAAPAATRKATEAAATPVPAQEPAQEQALPGVPTLQHMPVDFQRSVPSVRIDALVYSEDAAGRMVFIANHKYVEGQQVQGGLRIEKITRDGAVMSYGGQQFLLQP